MHTRLKNAFLGMDVIVHDLPPVPRIRLSPTFKWCTEQFRAEQNAWWLEQFGTKNVCYMISGKLVMPNSVFIDLKRAAKLDGYT